MHLPPFQIEVSPGDVRSYDSAALLQQIRHLGQGDDHDCEAVRKIFGMPDLTAHQGMTLVWEFLLFAEKAKAPSSATLQQNARTAIRELVDGMEGRIAGIQALGEELRHATPEERRAFALTLAPSAREAIELIGSAQVRLGRLDQALAALVHLIWE